MRRAIVCLILVACATTLAVTRGQGAGGGGRPTINAIGMINYSVAKPTFKPGDWVRYHVTSKNSDGDADAYYVTVLIAGEERFWGEDCFWVETRMSETADENEASNAVATLMSYSIFGDTLATSRSQLFMRKTIADIKEDGTPRQDLTMRPALTLKNRRPPGERTNVNSDTLGVDTVHTARGLYTCTMVKLEEGIAVTGDKGDSTARTETRETRTVYFAKGIPITGFARERIVNTIHRKSWPIGRSTEGDLMLVADSETNARLVDYGTGSQSLLVPKQFQRSFREQAAASSRPAASRAAAKKR